MLDLNLNADSASASVPISGSQMDSSGSFNSEDSCSYADAVAYNFAILKNTSLDDAATTSTPLQFAAEEGSVRTIQLFPAAGDCAEFGGVQRVSESASGSKGWLDFSSKEVEVQGDDGGVAEQRIIPQQQQRQTVKKSRRGPRSRSSQYRGVTFYRRTGRWESHIWFAIFDSVSSVL